MKNRKILFFCAVLCIAVLSACFSPWDGSGGDKNLKYTVTLINSDGKPIEVESTQTTPIVITVPQGEWDIEIKADALQDDDFAATRQRFVGGAKVKVSAKEEKITLAIDEMTPAIQVRDWSHVSNAFKKWGAYLDGIGWKPKSDSPEYYVEIIGDNLSAGETTTLNEDKNIVLWTKKPVTITRDSSMKNSLFKIDNGTLTLGRDELGQGDITIAGNKEVVKDSKESLIIVSGGELIMNKGVTITGNTTSSHGGGVHVNGGTFTMNGGEISHNDSEPTSFSTGNAGGGGGVFVDNGEFIMNGGSIFENTTKGHGGGVRVYTAGKFVMNGGYIHDNKSVGFGGGVRVRGTFTMTGGEIYENKVLNGGDSDNPGYGGGVGVAATGTSSQGSSGSFFMEGGTIRDNTAESGGGGVFKGPVGTFTLTGGTISGNKSGNEKSGYKTDDILRQ